MNTARRSRNPRSASVSAEDQPQRPRNRAGTQWKQWRPCAQPAAAGALRTQPRSGKKPRGTRGFCAARAAGRRPKKCCRRLALRPGGTPQDISRGQARAAGAAPGCCAAERAMPQRGIEEVFGGVLPAAFPSPLVASGHFLRCPVGARSQAARFPGAASAGADLPPANLLRRPSGTGTGRPHPQCVRNPGSSEHSVACLPPHALRPRTGRAPLLSPFFCPPIFLPLHFRQGCRGGLCRRRR